jgi:SAM-dependent methyltransferase
MGNPSVLPRAGIASLAAYSGDPWTPDNPYFLEAEKHGRWLWENLTWPFIDDSDFSTVLDLAAGHGRNSVFLLNHANRLIISDIQEGNVTICRERFGGRANVSFHVGNGYDFQPISGSELTLIFCFDAMVHFDSDVVRSYLRDTFRVLKPGGRGFFHHSNYTAGHDWRHNPNARNFMSKQLFEHYALREGLEIIRQKVINWGELVESDCLSLVERPHKIP